MSYYTVDFGSQYYVTSTRLQAMLTWHMETEPLEKDAMADAYINFMLKYGKFCAPKSNLEGYMKVAQINTYQQDPDKEEDGDFTAGFEWLTKIDQVYPIWMFMNSEDDWKTKRENPHDKSVSYACKTKWTSNMSSRRDGDQDEAVSEDGITMWNKISTFIKELLKSPHVPALRKLYNKRAEEMEILPTLKEFKNRKHQRRMETKEANGE
jgi:hypothetical protein